MKIFAFLMAIAIISPTADIDGGGGGKKNRKKKANYQKFEKEEVRSFRNVNDFVMPTPMAIAMEEEDLPVVTDNEPKISLDHYFRNGNWIYIENENQLDGLIRLDKRIKSETKYRKGWRVQIYTGSSRSTASSIKQRALRLYSEYKPQMFFTDRKYRVKIGNFVLKQDAELFKKELLLDFGNAFVVPDKIEVPKPER